ncbi:succinate dehydrogenase, cytochrome b556 subunit [Sphingomonas yabuuchiae]
MHPVGVFTIGVSANQPDFRLFEDLPLAARNTARPLSPHLQIWKWGPNMLVSILHRATGTGMATVGAALLVWFLAAVAAGPESYATFRDVFTVQSGGLNIIGYVVGIGLTACLFQHMANGIRHLFMDVGAGFELKSNKLQAQATMIFAVVMTVAFWLYLGIK